MASLTETAYYTRKVINWGILAIIGYIILRITWSLVSALWIVVFPPKAPPPNHAFGKLPAVKFPAVASPSGTITYHLETIEGSVPSASVSATVFFMPKNPSNLLALTNAQEFAARMEFTKDPIQETKVQYRFEDAVNPLRVLVYDIVSKNFLLRYFFEKDMSVFTEKNLPLEDAAKTEAKNMLQTYDLYADDIARGTNTIQYLKLVGAKLTKTTSYSQADSVRVDFFRGPVADTKVVTPYPDEGSISFVFSGSKDIKKRILQFAYTFWNIDYTTTATYGLKTSAAAWAELQSGKGYVARYPTDGSTDIIVRNAYLAYYDSLEPQTYLQPVFVFEGDNNFLAYIPAVASPWIEDQ